jgi:5-oxoprolinase (ATP-hydrolysing)
MSTINAEEAVRRLIGRLSDGAFSLCEMDSGAVIAVALCRLIGRRAIVTIDFTGTSPRSLPAISTPLSAWSALR